MTEKDPSLEDTMTILKTLHRFRNSESMTAIRKYLDSMNPEDLDNAERGIREFIESDESIEDFVQAIQRLHSNGADSMR